MALEKVEQHVEVGLLKLPPAYWGRPRISALVASLLREIQTLEDVIWAQFEAQHVNTAQRPALLKLGKLIGQTSEGFALEDLRTVIKARALANRSRGRGPEIGLVLVALLGAGNFEFAWAGPATIYVAALDPLTSEQVRMAQAVLPHATAAGVQLHLSYSDADYMLWGDAWGEDWSSVTVI